MHVTLCVCVCVCVDTQTVKTVDSSENNTKAIDSWIKNIADLHRTQPAPTVHYSKYEWLSLSVFLSLSLVTLRASCGAVYCNRSCLCLCVYGMVY